MNFMCGIIGCTGVKNAAKILYRGLEDLEYRGYDSAGIAVLEGGSIHTVKRKGRVSALKCAAEELCGTSGIGHTRWATHGRPSDCNAHPHSSGRFSVVHNGIIENYAELRAELIAEGYAFFSQTDSEVVVHLLNKYYEGDLKAAVISAVQRLKGAFALCILCEQFEGFVAVKYRNPIIVGTGGGAAFAASDMPALSGLAESVAVLKDGQIAFVTAKKISVCDFGGEAAGLTFSPIPAAARSVRLGGFPHFMIKEINEIPASVKNTVRAFCDEGCQGKLVRAAKKRGGFRDVMICGCGTAYHSALAATYCGEELLGIPVRAETAGEFRYKKTATGAGTLFIAVSQSGETADTVEAARAAKAAGAFVIAVTNVEYSAITGIADGVVPVRAGTEICVAATKSYCGQVAALSLIFAALKGGKTYKNMLSELKETEAKCSAAISDCRVEDAARACALSSGVYFIGRGTDYPVALEGSLKLKEVSYVPGEGYPAGELKHGTIALIDGGTLAVAVITDRALGEKTASAVEQIYSRGGRAVVVCASGCAPQGLKERADFYIEVPPCSKFLSPIVSVIPLQLIAYRTAVILGRDPDKPRNLAKSVTVE